MATHSNRHVIVAHPGTHHSYMTAAAFQHLGVLDKYATSFYYSRRSPLCRLLGSVSSCHKAMLRRRCDLLSDERVYTIPAYEAIERGLNATLFRGSSRDPMIYWRDRMFSRHVAAFVIRPSTRLVIGYPNACLEMLRTVRQQGGIAVLDLPIGHYRSAESVLREERELHPDFADSITYSTFDDTYRSRVEEEISIADSILVPSAFVRHTLLEHGVPAEKIVKIPYGSWAHPVAPEEVRFPDPGKPLRIIYFGQITQRKGIKYLLDSLDVLRRRGVSTECTMIGQLFGECRWLRKYEHLFKHLPHVPRPELKAHLLAHDLFLFPTLFEGSAYVIPEALAHGLPVVTTLNSGAECLQDGVNGFIVPIRDSEAIVEALQRLDADRELLYQIKCNALASSHAVTWQRYRETLSDWYQTHVERDPATFLANPSQATSLTG